MKQLLLMRHGMTDHPMGTSDRERVLTDEGIKQAEKQGDYIKSHFEVDYIACSSDIRTRQTLENLHLPTDIEAVFLDNLYLPSKKNLEEIITCELPDTAHTALIVTHFPGVLDFAHYYGHNIHSFPEASIATFQLNKLHWADFEKANVNFGRFIGA